MYLQNKDIISKIKCTKLLIFSTQGCPLIGNPSLSAPETSRRKKGVFPCPLPYRLCSYSFSPFSPPYLPLTRRFRNAAASRRDSSGHDVKFDRITTTTTTPGRDNGERSADGSGRRRPTEWAMGHPLLSMNPGLFVVATLWVREHNRLCDRLSREHPAWTDEQVYGTARRIVIGQMMRMMIDGGAVDGTAATGGEIPALDGARARADHGRFSTPFELLLIAMWPAGAPITFDGNRSPSGSGNVGARLRAVWKATRVFFRHLYWSDPGVGEEIRRHGFLTNRWTALKNLGGGGNQGTRRQSGAGLDFNFKEPRAKTISGSQNSP